MNLVKILSLSIAFGLTLTISTPSLAAQKKDASNKKLRDLTQEQIGKMNCGEIAKAMVTRRYAAVSELGPKTKVTPIFSASTDQQILTLASGLKSQPPVPADALDSTRNKAFLEVFDFISADHSSAFSSECTLNAEPIIKPCYKTYKNLGQAGLNDCLSKEPKWGGTMGALMSKYSIPK